MSHFVVLVLVPGDTQKEDIPAVLFTVLDPYDESKKVPMHERICECIGFQAQVEVDEQIQKKYDLDELRKELGRLPKKMQTQAAWNKLVAPMLQARQELLEKHPLKNAPHPECPICSGSGKYMTESNPQGKWDWWVVGGRWDGWIHGREREIERAALHEKGNPYASFEEEMNELLDNNVRPVREIDWADDYHLPFAVVTAQEGWHEVGKMRMFALVEEQMDDAEWHEVVRNIMERHMEYLAVAVDCHM